MLNSYEKVDYMEDEERSNNFEKETQNQIEFYDSNYKVNFFGVGHKSEDWQ